MTSREVICECGCGEVVSPGRRFRHGHNGRRSPEARFWEMVRKTDTCWLWGGRLAPHGYGSILVGKRHVRVHRFAYELLVGPIPAGLHIDHLCRVRHCVNPAHLEAVTNTENLRRGNSTKLTLDQVREIKRSNETQIVLAARYGVHSSHISQIRNGRAWADA